MSGWFLIAIIAIPAAVIWGWADRRGRKESPGHREPKNPAAGLKRKR